MMSEQVRQWLLEADISELEGEGGSEIARLVREDPAVRKEARRITAAIRMADRSLAELGNLAPPHASQQAAMASSSVPRAGFGTRRPRFLTATALATAAVAVLLLSRPGPQPSPAIDETEAEPLTARLAASSPRPLAVFATDNPDIAIVWLLDEEEE